MLIDFNNPPPDFLNDLMRRVNAFGHEPRVVVELDKMVYAKGLKSKYEVVEYVKSEVVKTYDLADPSELFASASIEIKEEEIATTVEDAPVMPLPGKSFGQLVITGKFGERRPGHYHKGLDIDLQTGDPVCSVWDGVVTFAGWGGSYGYLVKISHGNGIETRYAHLSKVLVRKGQSVQKGQTVGLGGSTGRSTGSHLHFEVRINGEAQNPVPILRGDRKIKVRVDHDTISTPQVKVKTTTITSPEVSTYYNDFQIPLATSVETKFTLNGAEEFTASHPNGYVKKLLGFRNVGAGSKKSFTFKHTWNRPGYIDWNYYANLISSTDVVKIYMDGKPIIAIQGGGKGAKGWVNSPPVHVKQGTHTFVFEMTNNGSTTSKAVFGITHINCVEFTNSSNKKQTKIYYTVPQYSEVVKEEWYDVGDMVYDDTVVIEDDILQWEVFTHYEQSSATATIVLDNSSGKYSPTYNKIMVENENPKNPFVYAELGKLRHVLSEGTPVRIYAGYGDNLVRVFTGYIKGEIEEDSNNRTVTFHCVDRFDMLEECVLWKPLSFPDEDSIDIETGEKFAWLTSSIVHYLAVFGGMTKWRIHWDDLQYPDLVIEETYYIDLREESKTVVKVDKDGRIVHVPIKSIKTADGYQNPFVQMIRFEVGEKVADCIRKVIQDIDYRVYCDRYGTFRLEKLDFTNNQKWDFIDGENLYELSTSTDYSRVRNHLIIYGSNGVPDHFFDKDLIVATKGQIRTAAVTCEWIDETLGSGRAAKEVVAAKLFWDMKRQARTKNLVVKGNPLIEVLDGCYIFDRNSSTAGYYIIKGNRLVGNQNGMLNFLEVTWEEDV